MDYGTSERDYYRSRTALLHLSDLLEYGVGIYSLVVIECSVVIFRNSLLVHTTLNRSLFSLLKVTSLIGLAASS